MAVLFSSLMHFFHQLNCIFWGIKIINLSFYVFLLSIDFPPRLSQSFSVFLSLSQSFSVFLSLSQSFSVFLSLSQSFSVFLSLSQASLCLARCFIFSISRE